jgi:hypothetical protein
MTRTHIVTGEVTTLEHELGNDAVEGRFLVAFASRFLAELTEVLGGLRDILIVEVEDNTANLGCQGTKQNTVSKKIRKH